MSLSKATIEMAKAADDNDKNKAFVVHMIEANVPKGMRVNSFAVYAYVSGEKEPIQIGIGQVEIQK